MSAEVAPPRRQGQGNAIRSGRTIGERRERIETSSERIAARQRTHRKKVARTLLTICGFLALTLLGALFFHILADKRESSTAAEPTRVIATPNIEIIDSDTLATGGHISSRMREYVGQLEAGLRAYSIIPTRAVIPVGAVREVDIYLDGYQGYLKTILDRDAATTARDADRMLRYLADQGITEFEYIDVRIDGKAYWK